MTHVHTVADFDQQHAAALDALRAADGFLLVTLDVEGPSVDCSFAAPSPFTNGLLATAGTEVLRLIQEHAALTEVGSLDNMAGTWAYAAKPTLTWNWETIATVGACAAMWAGLLGLLWSWSR
jgi:hypothetical protein